MRSLLTVLVEKDQLYLLPTCPDRSAVGSPWEKHFARVFSHVWSHIPDEDRQSLLGYWRPPTSTAPPHLRPQIRLVEDHVMADITKAVCYREGVKLAFAVLASNEKDVLPQIIA